MSKRSVSRVLLLLVPAMCLVLTACKVQVAVRDVPEETVDIIGPWHLDEEKNDLGAIEAAWETFPGYAEWGAGMEIRSDGHMSWYIGAVGGSGTYAVDGKVLHADLTDSMEQKEMPMDLMIMGTEEIKMNFNDMEFTWIYGDRGSE